MITWNEGVPYVDSLMLRSIGAKSGDLRDAVLFYVPDGENWVIIGSVGGRPQHPSWVHNLRANPHAWVFVNRKRHPVEAEFLEGDERERLWNAGAQSGRPTSSTRNAPSRARSRSSGSTEAPELQRRRERTQELFRARSLFFGAEGDADEVGRAGILKLAKLRLDLLLGTEHSDILRIRCALLVQHRAIGGQIAVVGELLGAVARAASTSVLSMTGRPTTMRGSGRPASSAAAFIVGAM